MKWGWIIGLQILVAMGVALIAYLLGGINAGITSVLASAVCVLPNMLMPIGFFLNDKVLKKSGFAVLFILEFLKIALTIALIVAVFRLYKDVNWVAFLVSFVIALKSYIILLSRSNN